MRKKGQIKKEQKETAAVPSGRKRHAKKKKVMIAATALGAAAVAGIFIVLTGRSGKAAVALGITVNEVAAEAGDISNTVVGTGNLEAGGASALNIPSGLVIEDVLVESGDQVSAGDALATVSEASVLGAMEEVQSAISELDEQIQENLESTAEVTVTAGVSGRVKVIYGSAGADAGDCMVGNGAIMALSADGKMAVTTDNGAGAAKGDAVTVSQADGTTWNGTVESVSGQSCVTVFSDEGAGDNETVTVTASDGAVLGSGLTYIHQKIDVTVTGGTISEISVSENEEVEAGDTLMVLESDARTVKGRELSAEREALVATLQELLTISKTCTITAAVDGTVSSVNISGSGISGSQSGSSQAVVASFASSYTGSAQAGTARLTSVSGTELPQPGEEDAGTQLRLAVKSAGTGTADILALPAPEKGKTPVAGIQAEDGSYSGTVVWSPDDTEFQAATVYTAEIELTAGEGYYFGADSILSVEIGVISGITVSEDKNSLSFRISFPETETEQQTPEDSGDHQSQQGGSGTEQSSEKGSSGNGGGTENGGVFDNSGTGNGSVSGDAGAVNMNAVNTYNTGAAVQGEASSATESGGSGTVSGSGSGSSDDSTDIAAFTIASGDEMILSVNVDELDINSISEDQEAEVTLDAIEGKSFAGTVTKVGASASASGGVAKYTVEITIPKDELMKEGMNASATIVIEKKENVVTIPVNALQERGNETFVYTEKDDEGNLSGEKTVTTGLSDGDIVEITEGLDAGDTVYYQKSGNTDSGSGNIGSFDFSQMPGEGDFGGGGFGGDMPDDMPDIMAGGQGMPFGK